MQHLTKMILLPKLDHKQESNPGFWRESPGLLQPTRSSSAGHELLCFIQ